jgi:hypothetical protein
VRSWSCRQPTGAAFAVGGVVTLAARGTRGILLTVCRGFVFRACLNTAQVHVKHILAKLKVKDRSAAITVALRRGIIHLS